MEKTITMKQFRNRKRAILFSRIYGAGMIIGIAGTIILSMKFDYTNFIIVFSMIMTFSIVGLSITLLQQLYYRAKFGKYQESVVKAADAESEVVEPVSEIERIAEVEPVSDEQLPVQIPEQIPEQTPEQTPEIVPEIVPVKKERAGFMVYLALMGRSLQWVIMGFLFVTILNIIPVIPRGKRSMLNILMRFFAFAAMFPYSVIGLILMIFIWGKLRDSLSASGNKFVDWYDYDRS